MLRRTALTLLAFALLATLWPAAGAAQAAKDYTAERYDAAVKVLPGGALEVTETVVFRFMGGPFTYVFREIPKGKTDGIEILAASMDGEPFPTGTQAGQVEVRDYGNRVRATWHFAGLSDSTHTFVLAYRAAGVVFQRGGADVLEWDALPDDRSYAIAASTVTLAYPAGAQPLAAPQVLAGRAQVETGDGQATFTARGLSARDTLTIGAQFPLGSVVTAQPEWLQRQAHIDEGTSRAAPLGLAACFGVMALGFAGLALFWNSQRRPDTAGLVGGAFGGGAPPSNLVPAVAGALTATGARASYEHALAALFDLARKGVLRIVELDQHRWWGGRQYAIELLERPSGLRPQEQGLLDILFQSKKGPRTTVKLEDFATDYAHRSKEFTEPLDQELQTLGLVDPARKRLGTRIGVAGLLAVGGGVLLAAIGVVAATIPSASGGFTSFYVAGSLIGAGIGLGVVGIGAAVVGGTYSPLSDRGAAQAEQWKQFRRYLNDVARGREVAPRLDAFEAYLPFAAAWGMLQQWGKIFGQQANAQVPAWFHGAAASLQNAHDSFGSFAAMTAAVHSSSSSAGAGAAGGAAGGGSSGAG